ncbi:MAG: cytochrome C [Verrucomicrobia bacterium]|nr:cytochrome C [Verrucomicrobiota bacterium]|tara:strand:+ start:768 stop:1172 length:405 start_codon:yes stop_codon:yes gene_type:complete
MKQDNSKVVLFIDEDVEPIAELSTPIQFELDTTKLTDGEHTLRIVSKSPHGKEGLRKIKFTVKNGPDITLSGLKDNQVIDGIQPIMINAYDKGNQKEFIIKGSETPESIPNWLWIIIILFVGWMIYYLTTNFNL